MKKLLPLLLLLLSSSAFSQILSPDNRIVVLASATLELPANQVSFHINLVTTDSLSLDKVYEGQKRMEQAVYQLLKDLRIPPKNISYSMLSVGKITDYESKNEYFTGRQYVNFTLDSIKAVPSIQEKLVRAGFSDFSSSFTSTEMETRKKELLEKAITVAKEKAATLAHASGRKIKRISKIADTDDADYTFSNYQSESYAVGASSGGSLTEIPQTVSLSTNIKVTFELK